MNPIVRPTIAEYLADGYAEGSGYAGDREIAEQAACVECGERRGRFVALYKLEAGRYHWRVYRAFAVCDACGHEHEF
jgi:hypothetical protein